MDKLRYSTSMNIILIGNSVKVLLKHCGKSKYTEILHWSGVEP
jgi:hypothetical protein